MKGVEALARRSELDALGTRFRAGEGAEKRQTTDAEAADLIRGGSETFENLASGLHGGCHDRKLGLGR